MRRQDRAPLHRAQLSSGRLFLERSSRRNPFGNETVMGGEERYIKAVIHIDLNPATSQNPPASGRQLAAVGVSSAESPPAIFLRSADQGKRFWEFFTANIRNRNTRKAYFVAVSQFFEMV